jgi:citrate transporter
VGCSRLSARVEVGEVSTSASIVVLVGALVFAVVRPWGLPEAVTAVPGACVVVALGLVSWRDVGRELTALGPTVGFLAAVLVLAHLADDAGVFSYAGSVAGRLSGGSPRRLLGVVFVIASVVTAVLSLDATVVLLTPVVLATAMRARVRAKPHLYACAPLANSASLLLPVSNLTNLLAYSASGLTFLGFAGLMALPWLTVVGTEYVMFRFFFAGDLAAPARREAISPLVNAPRFALLVLAGTLVGSVWPNRLACSRRGGEHPPEPDVCRLAGHPAVATDPARQGPPTGRLGVPAAGCSDCLGVSTGPSGVAALWPGPRVSGCHESHSVVKIILWLTEGMAARPSQPHCS